MTKRRLDQALVSRHLVTTRSQAETYVRLGKVEVNGLLVTKPGALITDHDTVILKGEQYVSRAGLKLASVAEALKLNFKDKLVLDVGSSTGGFSDYALQHGAKKVIAVDVGTDQMVSKLRRDVRIELHEQTDIRDFKTDQKIDMVMIDVSFISLREVLPSIAVLGRSETQVIAMAKPQFEAGVGAKHKGVIKNNTMRRNTLKELENWIQNLFKIVAKADSEVTGAKGNQERFYILKLLSEEGQRAAR